VDRVSAEQRSLNMSRIRARDTGPELTVRRFLHRLGYRYRLHQASLPGRPDIVFPARRKVVFVHGCHQGCPRAFVPSSRKGFWLKKLRANVERDARAVGTLNGMGWASLLVWECETRQMLLLGEKITRFLGPSDAQRVAGHAEV
jgi:DNA mismatch endonuclease (patch repair protein)